MKIKKMLFIDHEYHKKTRSTEFLIDILKKEYEISFVYYSFEEREFIDCPKPLREKFDSLVIFQCPIPMREIQRMFKFKIASFFPMFDSWGVVPKDFWIEYKSVNFINFSKTIHETVLSMGLCSHYIQFFPKPKEIKNWGDDRSAFFWQRTDRINVNYLNGIADLLNITKMNVHEAPDPENSAIYADEQTCSQIQVSYSTWFDNNEDLESKIQESSVYFAPRMLEGIGMSFLEAMANGRCVVAPNFPTMNEYISSGETGILYDYEIPGVFRDYNIKEIQEKTYQYMCDGFKSWSSKKGSILEWIEQKPIIDKKLYKEYRCKAKFVYWIYMGKFRLFGVTKDNKYYLFEHIKVTR